MNEYDVIRLALVLAVNAEIEGMKAENLFRVHRGEQIAWDEKQFQEMAENLRQLAYKHNEEL